jgi:hypothetical protein
VQPQSAVHDGLPGIDTRPVGAVVVRLEPPAGQQLGIGDQKSLELQRQPQKTYKGPTLG